MLSAVKYELPGTVTQHYISKDRVDPRGRTCEVADICQAIPTRD